MPLNVIQYAEAKCSVQITWKPEYAGPPHLFSLPHRAHAVAENLVQMALHLFFCNLITGKVLLKTRPEALS